ncbi:MAG TPA: MMPL family transporter, partial [Conexibacter sp.]|nr:MMPL family transporter [Conexibacter sp.]
MAPSNFAARAGRWSARHRKAAVLAWIAFVFAAFAVGNVAVGSKEMSDRDDGVGESGRAEQILYDSFPQRADETVLIASRGGGTDPPGLRAAVGDVVEAMQRRPEVVEVSSPYAPGNAGQVARDGSAALVTMELRGDEDDERDVERVLATTAALQRAHPDLRIEQFGDASAEQAIGQMFEDDFKKAEFLSIPITLVILVAAFGAFVAAGIPLLLALSSVMATLGLVALGSHVVPVEESVASVVLLIGLAVGVDYTLFYLRREREERAAGRSEQAALEAAAATSGRAVLISGLTVMIAMAGMFIAGSAVFVGMAMGAILVVGVSLIASLTVLPALLSKLGDRVERGRIPILMRRRTGNAPGEGHGARAWGAVIDAVLRRPLASLLVAGGLLLALCLPVLGMHTALPGTDTLPRSLAVMQTYDHIQEHLPGKEIAATVAVKSDQLSTPAGRAALAELRRDALASGVVHEPISIDVARGGRVAAISLPIDGDGADEASHRSLETIRGELTPALRAALPGADVAVTGMTAGTADFNTLMNARIGWVFAFVLTLAFLLLLVTFRSVVIAGKAIALNLLSVGAAYGVLVLVFQHGWGESLL